MTTNLVTVLQPSSYVLCVVLLSIQEPAVHPVAQVQVEDHHVLADLSLDSFGGSLHLCNAGRFCSESTCMERYIYCLYILYILYKSVVRCKLT